MHLVQSVDYLVRLPINSSAAKVVSARVVLRLYTAELAYQTVCGGGELHGS